MPGFAVLFIHNLLLLARLTLEGVPDELGHDSEIVSWQLLAELFNSGTCCGWICDVSWYVRRCLLPAHSQHIIWIINFNERCNDTSIERKLHGFLLLNLRFPLSVAPDPTINNTSLKCIPCSNNSTMKIWKKRTPLWHFRDWTQRVKVISQLKFPSAGWALHHRPHTTQRAYHVLSFAWFLWSVTHPQRKFTLNGVPSLYGV